MIVYFDANCPYCIELSRIATGRTNNLFSGIPGLEPRLRTHTSYDQDRLTHKQTSVPMLISARCVNLGGWSTNHREMSKLGITSFIQKYDSDPATSLDLVTNPPA